MKIGVLSDSHDNIEKLSEGVQLLCAEEPSLILHGGDYIAPFTARCFKPLKERDIPFLGIFGNNDGERFGLRAMYESVGRIHEDPHLFEFGGRRLLLTHKETLVDSLAKSGDFDVVIYGHTHTVDVRTEPCLIVNPGRSGAWTTGDSSAALIDLANLTVEIRRY